MEKLNKKVSKVLAVLGGTALVSLIFTRGVMAWGPERATYTMESPAESATFNSITDNAAVGDERDFVRIVKVGTGAAYSNEVTLEDKAEYEVYIYYHNDASSTYNDKKYDYRGVARETRLASSFPINVKAGERGTVTGTISSSTTTPEKVWDEAYLKAEEGKEFNLAYKEGSAKIYNDWGANESTLSAALFSENGTLLGLNELNGLILGCDEFSGQVVYRIVATEIKGAEEPEPEPEDPKFYIEKRASFDGGDTWQASGTVKPGDEIMFRIKFQNIGAVKATNVTAFDTLETGDGMSYIAGSTEIKGIDGTVREVEDGIFKSGIILGDFNPGQVAEVYYKVRISKETGKFSCGETTLYNGAAVSFGKEKWKGSEGGDESGKGAGSGVSTLYDKVKIVVKREDCIPEELPTTGPAEIILAIIVILGIGTGVAYYIVSRKNLEKLKKEVTEKK